MKTGILAGGLGSRLAEETVIKPKPMVEIGGRPILWHIMRHYLRYGYSEFVIAAGYKGEVIKRWMLDYATLASDVTVRPRHGEVTLHRRDTDEDWTVNVVDTGESTNTGGRIKRLQPWVGDETFLLTWGDGVSDVNIDTLLEFHRSHGKIATLTAVRPPARYGHLVTDGDQIVEFSEKPQIGEGWINGAFFVLEPAVFDYIAGDDTQFEKEPLEELAKDGQLMAYRHYGFWQCMDTMREKHILEELWRTENAPWKTWE
ncbi:glucose-1-phosphate cytidylyltransferase [Phytoactinopolyspora halotolerans]|uniref:Glucose-1-phosphate cytidylyltransferase n=1 Tax=Phytoactinopolyspora halotolerans TaxID=1981512 RepID=A0A6L9S549_9ACTN|nr:glucose-1-phosphate cytidylyltransferase [Phytoactinopolyspora halotolerans]NED99621.1 glucose-1-phosphate cytidylyltransferase [Phytoactinopolyspora halotolerans]